MIKRQIWDTWEGRRARNTRTGETYIETKTADWEVRYKAWVTNIKAGCPCPMPQGHIIFNPTYPRTSHGMIEHL
jgi:hypothetical protein